MGKKTFQIEGVPALITSVGLQNELCVARDEQWTGWNVVPIKVQSRNSYDGTEKWLVKADEAPTLERLVIRQDQKSYWKLDTWEDLEPYQKATQLKLEKNEQKWKQKEDEEQARGTRGTGSAIERGH